MTALDLKKAKVTLRLTETTAQETMRLQADPTRATLGLPLQTYCEVRGRILFA